MFLKWINLVLLTAAIGIGGCSIYMTSSLMATAASLTASFAVVLYRLVSRYDHLPETDYLQSGEAAAAVSALLLFSAITGYGYVSLALTGVLLWIVQALLRNLTTSDSRGILYVGASLAVIFFFPVFIFGMPADEIFLILSGESGFIKFVLYAAPPTLIFLIILMHCLKPQLYLTSMGRGYQRIAGGNTTAYLGLIGFSRSVSVLSAVLFSGITGSFSFFLSRKIKWGPVTVSLTIFIITQIVFLLINTGLSIKIIIPAAAILSYIVYFYTVYTENEARHG